jgi:hypothetical protein
MTWHPISTAPKNHTRILGWREDCGILVISWTCPGAFMSSDEIEADPMTDEQTHDEGWFFEDLNGGGRLEGWEIPTHWMHFPSEPEIE